MKEQYMFTCSKCGHKFIPTFWRWLIAPHNDICGVRYFKCDNCGEQSWMKKEKK